MPESRPSCVLTIPKVAEELATSTAQITALVRRGELPALKLGGRGQWRIERDRPEEFIARAYEDTARIVQAGEADPDPAARAGRPPWLRTAPPRLDRGRERTSARRDEDDD